MQIFPNINYGYSSYDPDVEIPDLRGKVALVTGANAGIGYHTAKVLASKGAKVYLGARDEGRGKAALQSIEHELSGPSAGSVHWLPLDLSTPQRTKAGAEAFSRAESRLDILIHNAAMQVLGYSTVSEGGLTFNKIMSTNHLGSFVLTQELMPVLKRTALEPNSDVRVVVVSSNMHSRTPGALDLRNLEGWNAYKGDGIRESGQRYAISKLANILFTRELQAKLDRENIPITCIAVHPGVVSTKGPQSTLKPGIFALLVKLIVGTLGLTPFQGAYTSLFAATSPRIRNDPAKYKGSYMRPYNRVTEPAPHARDKQLAEDLWACSKEVAEICLLDSDE